MSKYAFLREHLAGSNKVFPLIPGKPLNSMRRGKCLLCGKPSDPDHIAAGCQVALQQGRYLWRHNQVLHAINNEIMTRQRDTRFTLTMDSDNGTPTLPFPVFGPIRLRPDMVFSMKNEKRIIIMELTCPLSRNMSKWSNLKREKYSHLVPMARARGWAVYLHAVEVASDGQTSPSFTTFLQDIGFHATEAEPIVSSCSKVSVECTSVLMAMASNQQWVGPTQSFEYALLLQQNRAGLETSEQGVGRV